jgi:hypothetical protein
MPGKAEPPSPNGKAPPAEDPAEPQVLRITQPQCPAMLYLSDAVVLTCSQPAGHASMPGHPSTHSITLQWTEDVARVSPQAGNGAGGG